MIDKRSPVPIYYQIEEHIKKQIDSGELRPGDAIPSEREYTEAYGVSRMTVRQAINNLVNAEYLYRQKGKGTFVSENKVEQTLQALTSFTEDMKARGLVPGSKLIQFDIKPAKPTIAEQLNINEHDAVYEIKRIRLADHEPMALETTYISANRVKGLTEDIINQSLYDYIEHTLGNKISHGIQSIESVIVRDEETKYLQIKPGAPVLLMQRNTFLEDETPLELVKSVYRSDRYKFVINMQRF